MTELSIMQSALVDAQTPEEREIICAGLARLLDLQATMDADTVVLLVVCAWCLAENGILPQSTDSHGICQRHAAQIVEQSQTRRLTRLGHVA